MKERIKEIKKKIQDYNMELAILETMAEYEESIKPKKAKVITEPVINKSKPNLRIRIIQPWVFKGVAHIQPNVRKKEVVIC
jgi:hypothetical protein